MFFDGFATFFDARREETKNVEKAPILLNITSKSQKQPF